MIKTFAWKKFIIYTILTTMVDYLFSLFVIFIVDDSSSEQLIKHFLSLCLLITLYKVCVIFIYRNSLCIVKLDKHGISNKYFSINWKDAANYKIITASIGRIPFKAQDDIICFGNVESRSFIELNPRKCIFVALTPAVEQYVNMNTKN